MEEGSRQMVLACCEMRTRVAGEDCRVMIAGYVDMKKMKVVSEVGEQTAAMEVQSDILKPLRMYKMVPEMVVGSEMLLLGYRNWQVAEEAVCAVMRRAAVIRRLQVLEADGCAVDETLLLVAAMHSTVRLMLNVPRELMMDPEQYPRRVSGQTVAVVDVHLYTLTVLYSGRVVATADVRSTQQAFHHAAHLRRH